jgi:HTH-type transcriptional regulator / antitoxin HigA
MEDQLIKVIKNEEQYKVILQRIKSFWACPENSPEADLLEVLSIFADDYENEHFPITPIL